MANRVAPSVIGLAASGPTGQSCTHANPNQRPIRPRDRASSRLGRAMDSVTRDPLRGHDRPRYRCRRDSPSNDQAVKLGAAGHGPSSATG